MRQIVLLLCLGLGVAACGSDQASAPADVEATDTSSSTTSTSSTTTTTTATSTTTTTTTTTTTQPPVETSAPEYVEALAVAIVEADDEFFGTDPDRAACLAEGVVAAVELDHLRSIGDGPAVGEWFMDGPGPEFDEPTAVALGRVLVDCLPEIRALLVEGMMSEADQPLSPEAHACVADALQEATVFFIADAFSAELFPIGLDVVEAEAVVVELLDCSPAVRDVFRDAMLEGIALGGDLIGTETPPAVVDCMIEFLEAELLVPMLRSTVMGTSGFETLRLAQWAGVIGQTCWPPVPIDDAAAILGQYALQGVNPGPPGDAYSGTLTIAEGPDGIVVTWDLGALFVGHGQLTEDGVLVVDFDEPVPGSGEWYLNDLGALVGRWSETGSDDEGIEVWWPME